MPKSTTTPKAQAEAEKRKLDTLVRAVEAAKDGKDYTRKDDKFYLMVDELKAYKKEVSVYWSRLVPNCDIHIRFHLILSFLFVQFGDCNVPSVSLYLVVS